MKKTFRLIQVFTIVSFLTIGCGSKSSDPQPTSSITIQQYTLHYTGEPISSTITLPQQLNDANWGLKETTCEQVGYTLLPYAGENITSIKYSIIETYGSEPLYLWVLEQNQTTICAYLTVRESSTLTPGIFALNNPNIK